MRAAVCVQRYSAGSRYKMELDFLHRFPFVTFFGVLVLCENVYD